MTDFSGQHYVDRELSFWSKVDKKGSDECWNWNASTNRGYGQFWIGHTFVGAHRYAYESATNTKIPLGMSVLHHCDNPLCCNPSHLYVGDNSDNMRDKSIRNRVATTLCAHPAFHESEILSIRKLKILKSEGKHVRYKFPENLVAKMFDVNQSVIHRIWNSNKYLSKEGTYV